MSLREAYGSGRRVINSYMGRIVRLGCPGNRIKMSCRSGEHPGKTDVGRRNSSKRPTDTDGPSDTTEAAVRDRHREMVSLVSGECGSQVVYKRRRTSGASPPGALLTDQQRLTVRKNRKQILMSKLSDSGFEEDLGSSPVTSPDRTDVSALCSGQSPTGQLSCWFLQYGDIGFRIQREKEAQFHSCKSLARQPQLTAESRCKLVSWLIPVHKHLRLSFECCCLAVNIMDRFMASTPVAADCFQLLGVTALLLASKQVEVCSPRITHLLSLCCDSFTKEQLCNLECLILLRLNFRLAAPTLAFFLDYYANITEVVQHEAQKTGGASFARINPDGKRPELCSNLAQKVCELSLADYAFNKYPPSMTAHCALRIASELLKAEHGLIGHIQSQQEQWEELYTQPPESRAPSGADYLAVKGHFLSVCQGSYNNNMAQECKDNLRLLVSLNQDTLDVLAAE